MVLNQTPSKVYNDFNAVDIMGITVNSSYAPKETIISKSTAVELAKDTN